MPEEISRMEVIETGEQEEEFPTLEALTTAELVELDDTTLGEIPSEIVEELGGELKTESIRLSRNFVVAEFHSHDGVHVPGVAIPGLMRLVRHVLQPMREEFGTCTVNSGFRSPAHNEAVGGVPNSQHIYPITPSSVAADVKFASGGIEDWALMAGRRMGGGGGVGRYNTFVHVDNRPTRSRWTG